MRDSTKIAPKLSSLTKQQEVAAPAPVPAATSLPTPVSCWANDVPDEFQTPLFGGQKPPEEVFADTPTVVVETQNFPDSEEVEVTGEDHEMGTTDEERIAYLQQVQYDYDAQVYYAQGGQYIQEEGAPMAPADPGAAMISWYHSMLTWVAETDARFEMHLPPPPPPPSDAVAPHMRPYTFEQWGARINRWHSYVMAEYYNNVIHPEAEVRHENVRPQMRQYTTRAAKYQEPMAPQPSYHYQPQYGAQDMQYGAQDMQYGAQEDGQYGYDVYGAPHNGAYADYHHEEVYHSPQAYQSQVRVHQPYGAVETHEAPQYTQDFPPISLLQSAQRKTVRA